MRRSILLLMAIATPAFAQQQSAAANIGVSSTKMMFMMGHNYIARAAEQTPDSLWSFKPTPDVRSLGELYGHVAGSEHMICAIALGEKPPAVDYEKMGKAQVIEGLKSGAAYCDKAYAMSDADAGAMVTLFGSQRTKLFTLTLNATHDWEHYGNIVTYLRLKGMVPPSSQR
jgi:uncharacterized damage-inducible protein DinB